MYLELDIHLIQAVNNENMEKMVALLKDTNALREPILQIKNTVDNIFELIKGSLYLQVSRYFAPFNLSQTMSGFAF